MGLWPRLRNNLGLKLLSLVTAFVIWGTVQTQTDPLVVRRKTLKIIPVAVPRDLAPVSIEPPELTLTLVGRVSAFDRLAMMNPRLTADLSAAATGPYNAILRTEGLPPGIQVREMPRTTALIDLDSMTTVTRPVYVELRGRPAPGFAVNRWQVKPNELTLQGPSSLLQRVDRVVAEVDVSGRTTTLTAEVTVGVRDAANVLLSGINADPGQVTVSVLLRQVNSKTVPVVPVLAGPPEGYEIVSVVVTPSVVTLQGPAAALASVDAVQTRSLDTSRLTGRATLSAFVRVPQGCDVLGASSVRVTVTLRPRRAYGKASSGPASSTLESEQNPDTATPTATSPASAATGQTSEPPPQTDGETP